MTKNSKITIDKGVPIPPGRTRLKYPWRDMEVGDSFFIDSSHGGLVGAANFKQAPKRYAGRKEKTGLRIWRVE